MILFLRNVVKYPFLSVLNFYLVLALTHAVLFGVLLHAASLHSLALE